MSSHSIVIHLTLSLGWREPSDRALKSPKPYTKLNPSPWFSLVFPMTTKELTTTCEGQGAFYSKVFKILVFPQRVLKANERCKPQVTAAVLAYVTLGTCHSTTVEPKATVLLFWSLYFCLELETQGLFSSLVGWGIKYPCILAAFCHLFITLKCSQTCKQCTYFIGISESHHSFS